MKVATSCRRCRRRSIRLKVYLPTRGKCNLVHLVKETILCLDVTWMTTVQPSLVPHNISAKVHAPADIHDKGDSLGMLLPAKGKAFWLATAHIDGFAASDTILKRQVLQEAGKIVEMHHPQFKLKIFLVIVQIEWFFIQSFLFITPRDDQSILIQLPCGLVLQPLTFSFTSFLALQANLPMRRAKGRRDSTGDDSGPAAPSFLVFGMLLHRARRHMLHLPSRTSPSQPACRHCLALKEIKSRLCSFSPYQSTSYLPNLVIQ